jgi:hypothetical protein
LPCEFGQGWEEAILRFLVVGVLFAAAEPTRARRPGHARPASSAGPPACSWTPRARRVDIRRGQFAFGGGTACGGPICSGRSFEAVALPRAVLRPFVLFAAAEPTRARRPGHARPASSAGPARARRGCAVAVRVRSRLGGSDLAVPRGGWADRVSTTIRPRRQQALLRCAKPSREASSSTRLRWTTS